MRVYVKGIPSIVSVDDTIPFLRWDNGIYTPKFANVGRDGSIWGMLMEKVWAKINGNYESIIRGFAVEAFESLGGCPSTRF
jgi:hypothetical protein